MVEAVVERSLQSRILEIVDGTTEPNPLAIAEALIDELSADELHALAKYALRERVSQTFREVRRQTGLGPSASGRWAAVREAQASGELDLARVMIFTGRDCKWLLDCTASDLANAADHNLKVAFTYEELAAKFDKASKAILKTKGATVFGDLPNKVILGVLNS
jgi:hypothetical protein